MIILDTNVISEPMKPDGDPKVLAWLNDQAAETLYLTSVNLAELLAGLEILPDGKRKAGLHQKLLDLLSRLFEGRVLPFDEQAAIEFAPLIARARSTGRVISMADGQIAAIAKTRGFTVATRDLTPFEAAGVPIINPWEI